MQHDIKWCSEIKDGLRIIDPDEFLSKSYMKEAKSSLKRAEKNFDDGDLLWTTIVIYYAEYYALYSFLQRIGVKCENHFCSILAAESLLGTEKTKTIIWHKENRIDAQYYMRVGKEEDVYAMLKESKAFVAEFDAIVSSLSAEEIYANREKLRRLMR